MIAKDYNSRSAAYGWCLRTNENQRLHDGKQLFFRGHHRFLTVVILPSSIKSAGSLKDGQSSLVEFAERLRARGRAVTCSQRLHPCLHCCFYRILMFVLVANCVELSRDWIQQLRQSFRTHMTLFGWHGLGARLRYYRALISILIRRSCPFSNFLDLSRMQIVNGVSGASSSVTWASILAGSDKIDASRFRSANTMRGRALDGFLLFKHLSKVIGLLSSSRLVTCTWIYCLASIVTFASHGPEQ